jgi:tRNA(Ser,Leu) C12 N-acetylase TAN1
MQDRRAIALEALRATLAGLTEVHVQVEPVQDDAERQGLHRADLQAGVESALGAAGLRVVTAPELFARVPGTPFLHLDVMTHELDGRCAYSARLALWQRVRLVRDPAIGGLAVTWSSPQLVGTVGSEHVGEIRHAVQSLVARFLEDLAAAAAPGPAAGGEQPDYNLLVSSSWWGRGAVAREIRELLGAVGDDRPRVEPTVARGLTGVRTALDPRRAVAELRRMLEQTPRRFRFTAKWVPVDAWTAADIGALKAALPALRGRIARGDRWRMTVEKHQHVRHHTRDVVAALAPLIDARVDLAAPDKIVRIDLVGDRAALAVLAPSEILSVAAAAPR